MGSPSPIPSSLVEKKGSKILLLISSGIPEPVSRIAISRKGRFLPPAGLGFNSAEIINSRNFLDFFKFKSITIDHQGENIGKAEDSLQIYVVRRFGARGRSEIPNPESVDFQESLSEFEVKIIANFTLLCQL